MRSIKFIAVAALALSYATHARAADLPKGFLGEWMNDDGADQAEVTGISVAPRSYHEPGYNCDIKSVTAKDEAGSVNRGRVYVVEMLCTGDGENPGPRQRVREVWALRKINGAELLVTAGASGATYPSVHILQRPK